MAGIKEGDRVLDVACCYGEPSLTAARKVGPDGTVIGTDISGEMIAFGRECLRKTMKRNVARGNDAQSLHVPLRLQR